MNAKEKLFHFLVNSYDKEDQQNLQRSMMFVQVTESLSERAAEDLQKELTPIVEEAKALNREKYPLDRMYQEWLDTDVSEMQMLKDSIDDTAKKAVKEMKDKQKESR